MNFARFIASISLVALALSSAAAKDHDVVIYGGTPSGIIAGVAAAREGASVIVIEPTKWIGGMVTGGLTSTDLGNTNTIGGYTFEYFKRASSKPNTPLWYAAPHDNMAAFKAMLEEAKIDVVTGQRLKSVARDGARIKSFTTGDGKTYTGRMFIDATYEGDLMARAGVSYIVGRESTSKYNESLAGFHPMPIRPRTDDVMDSFCACIGGKGVHYIHGTPKQISARDSNNRPIFGVTESNAVPGSADKLTQSYNFRVVVTQRADNRVPFPQPRHYDASRYELLLRLIKSYPAVRFGRLVHLAKCAEDKYDLNAQGLCSTDYAGGNVDYPDGNYARRQRIWQDHVDYVQGYLWFLGHDDRVPKALRDETNEWGLCRDEFTDNANWPYALYVREARRMIGEYVLVQSDCQKQITKPDSVGMGSFVLDCHIVQRLVTPDGYVTDEGSFQDAPTRPYQIPFRCLTPKRAECENLLVPVCLSASHIAYCSLRMEPVYMALGQASGVAAAMALKGSQSVQSVDVKALQTKLREQKAVLELKGMAQVVWAESLPGIVVDDEDAKFTGAWQASGYGNPIDGTSHHDSNSSKGQCTAQFSVKVQKAGMYEVRLAYTPSNNRATKVPVTIEHADGTASVVVNQRTAPSIGGHFVSLGIYRFTAEKEAAVVISNAATDGYVVADAMQLLPAK